MAVPGVACQDGSRGQAKPGAPDRNRTCDLQIRNLPLYPTELRALIMSFIHVYQKQCYS